MEKESDPALMPVFELWLLFHVCACRLFPSIILFIIPNSVCLSVCPSSVPLLLTDTLVDFVFLLRRGRSFVKCWSFFSSSDGSSASAPFGSCCGGCCCDGVGGVRDEASSTWTGTSSRALSRSNSISAVATHTMLSLTLLSASV